MKVLVVPVKFVAMLGQLVGRFIGSFYNTFPTRKMSFPRWGPGGHCATWTTVEKCGIVCL